MGAPISGYQPWVARNHSVISNSIDMYVEQVKKAILNELKLIADEMSDLIERLRDTAIPVYSGNLHDATGLAIYVDGRTFYLKVPAKTATRRQHTGGAMGNRRNIDGHDFLMRSIAEGAGVYSNGIWIVLYSAVPYAGHIDTLGSPFGRGVDYFWNLRQELEREVRASLTEIKKVGVFNV